ncbi:hypothetical protein TNIN_328721 [Trichonephila inaurata madagascariensis]|uniref:Uncharacterized protein n=1 Tax=Trichonephila inaurata madagascariensis TaxID=2747483 RepID=A0A8X7BWH8_9ARAC|nr:hypothetical protein TNIN_328721 [Trichonephila inaurata madagascariensis]
MPSDVQRTGREQTELDGRKEARCGKTRYEALTNLRIKKKNPRDRENGNTWCYQGGGISTSNPAYISLTKNVGLS